LAADRKLLDRRRPVADDEPQPKFLILVAVPGEGQGFAGERRGHAGCGLVTAEAALQRRRRLRARGVAGGGPVRAHRGACEGNRRKDDPSGSHVFPPEALFLAMGALLYRRAKCDRNGAIVNKAGSAARHATTLAALLPRHGTGRRNGAMSAPWC